MDLKMTWITLFFIIGPLSTTLAFESSTSKDRFSTTPDTSTPNSKTDYESSSAADISTTDKVSTILVEMESKTMSTNSDTSDKSIELNSEQKTFLTSTTTESEFGPWSTLSDENFTTDTEDVESTSASSKPEDKESKTSEAPPKMESENEICEPNTTSHSTDANAMNNTEGALNSSSTHKDISTTTTTTTMKTSTLIMDTETKTGDGLSAKTKFSTIPTDEKDAIKSNLIRSTKKRDTLSKLEPSKEYHISDDNRSINISKNDSFSNARTTTEIGDSHQSITTDYVPISTEYPEDSSSSITKLTTSSDFSKLPSSESSVSIYSITAEGDTNSSESFQKEQTSLMGRVTDSPNPLNLHSVPSQSSQMHDQTDIFATRTEKQHDTKKTESTRIPSGMPQATKPDTILSDIRPPIRFEEQKSSESETEYAKKSSFSNTPDPEVSQKSVSESFGLNLEPNNSLILEVSTEIIQLPNESAPSLKGSSKKINSYTTTEDNFTSVVTSVNDLNHSSNSPSAETKSSFPSEDILTADLLSEASSHTMTAVKNPGSNISVNNKGITVSSTATSSVPDEISSASKQGEPLLRDVLNDQDQDEAGQLHSEVKTFTTPQTQSLTGISQSAGKFKEVPHDTLQTNFRTTSNVNVYVKPSGTSTTPEISAKENQTKVPILPSVIHDDDMIMMNDAPSKEAPSKESSLSLGTTPQEDHEINIVSSVRQMSTEKQEESLAKGTTVPVINISEKNTTVVPLSKAIKESSIEHSSVIQPTKPNENLITIIDSQVIGSTPQLSTPSIQDMRSTNHVSEEEKSLPTLTSVSEQLGNSIVEKQLNVELGAGKDTLTNTNITKLLEELNNKETNIETAIVGVKTTVSVNMHVEKSNSSSNEQSVILPIPIQPDSQNDSFPNGTAIENNDSTSVSSITTTTTTTETPFRIRKPQIPFRRNLNATRAPIIKNPPTRRITAENSGTPVSIFRKARTRIQSITSSTTPGTPTKYNFRRGNNVPVRIVGTETIVFSLPPTTTPSTTTEAEEEEEEEEEETEEEFIDEIIALNRPIFGEENKLLKISGELVVEKGLRWREALNNRQSPEFKKQSERMLRTLRRIFGDTPLSSTLHNITVDGFLRKPRPSRGVIVDYFIYMKKTENPINGSIVPVLFNEKLFNKTYGRYVFDPMSTRFLGMVEETIIRPTEKPDIEPPIPQWAIAVIVVGAASFIFIVLFAAVTAYGRHHMRRRYANKLNDDDVDRSDDSREWENKLGAAAYENLAADGIYDVDDSGGSSVENMKRSYFVD